MGTSPSERGLDRDRITWREPTAETQTTDLLELADEHDFVIMGEEEPSLAERVLGELPDRHPHPDRSSGPRSP